MGHREEEEEEVEECDGGKMGNGKESSHFCVLHQFVD